MDLKTYQKQAKIELARRELSRRELIPFIKQNFYEYQTNWHHQVIADALQKVEKGEITRLMIFMPPRHGKSELCTVQFPAWYLGLHPRQQIISVSYSSDLAIEFGRRVRNIVGSQEYANIFPEVRLSAQSKAADMWMTNMGGSYVATGVGGSITGKGANILIIDDPFKGRQEADSPHIRDMTESWYRGTAYTRLTPRGAIILIMTRWHDDDLAGRILNQPSGSWWHIISLEAIAKEDQWVEGKYVRKKGTALWPQKWPLDVLETIKESSGPYEFSAQYQQNPIDEESIEFKREWFKERKEDEVQKLLTLRYLTCDTAGKMKEGSNYIGLVDNRVDKEGNWNITGRKLKMDPGLFVDYLFVLQEKYHYESIGIEKTMLLDGLEPYIETQEQIRGITLPVVELHHKGASKQLRIRGLIPFYRAGKIYHIIGYCEDLVPQLLRFPKSADDDIVDALAYQGQIARAPFGMNDDDFPTYDPEIIRERKEKESGKFDAHSPIGSLDI